MDRVNSIIRYIRIAWCWTGYCYSESQWPVSLFRSSIRQFDRDEIWDCLPKHYSSIVKHNPSWITSLDHQILREIIFQLMVKLITSFQVLSPTIRSIPRKRFNVKQQWLQLQPTLLFSIRIIFYCSMILVLLHPLDRDTLHFFLVETTIITVLLQIMDSQDHLPITVEELLSSNPAEFNCKVIFWANGNKIDNWFNFFYW